MVVACNGVSYIDNNDPSKSWGFLFSEDDTDIYNEIMQAIIEGSIKGGMESVFGWEEWFKEKGHIYERIFSDEELSAMANGKGIKWHRFSRQIGELGSREKTNKAQMIKGNQTLHVWFPYYISVRGGGGQWKR